MWRTMHSLMLWCVGHALINSCAVSSCLRGNLAGQRPVALPAMVAAPMLPMIRRPVLTLVHGRFSSSTIAPPPRPAYRLFDPLENTCFLFILVLPTLSGPQDGANQPARLRHRTLSPRRQPVVEKHLAPSLVAQNGIACLGLGLRYRAPTAASRGLAGGIGSVGVGAGVDRAGN